MFDVSYAVDGCQLFRVTDTAKLGKPRVELGWHVIPAGTHVILVTTFFRSGSSADMHDDPRQRMRVELLTKVVPQNAP